MPCAWSASSGFPSSDRLSRLLFLERHGHRRVRREANPLPLDVGDQPEVDEMRVALVLALAAVALREPEAPVGDTVDRADLDAVPANHFHVLGDLVRGHLVTPLVSPIALEQGVLRHAEPRELPTRVRREEIAAARAEVSRRGYARAASQNELPGHELAIVHADRAVDRAE